MAQFVFCGHLCEQLQTHTAPGSTLLRNGLCRPHRNGLCRAHRNGSAQILRPMQADKFCARSKQTIVYARKHTAKRIRNYFTQQRASPAEMGLIDAQTTARIMIAQPSFRLSNGRTHIAVLYNIPLSARVGQTTQQPNNIRLH